MANYTGMSMEQLHQLAISEAPNGALVQNAAKVWTAIPQALVEIQDALTHGSADVCGCWEDRTSDTAFQAPVEEGIASIRNSEQTITQAKPSEVLQALGGQIDTTSQQVAELYQAWFELKQLAEAMPMLAAVLQQIMEQLRLQAANLMNALGQTYDQATRSVQAAAQGHSWNGPRAGAPPSVSADSGAPGSAQYATASAGPGSGPSAASTASGTGQSQVSASASASTDPGGQQGSGDDTGLAGGTATMPVPPGTSTIPPAGGATPVPPITGTPAPASAGVPVAGAGVAAARMFPVAAAGLGSRSQPAQIPQAAKVSNGITSASSGQAPAAAEVTTGSAAVKGTRSTTPAFPMGAGVPAALSPLAMSNLQGLIRRLKPIVTQHGVPHAERPATIPGVPKGLQGRIARTDDDTGFPVRSTIGSRHRRSGGKDAVPETVQLLDEEIWQVEQANANTEKVPTRR